MHETHNSDIKSFFREWRQYRALSQDRAADRIGIDRSHLSRIETGKSGYAEWIVEMMATAYRCERNDLFVRNPLDLEAPWSIWDQLTPPQRRQAHALLITLRDTGT